MNCSTMNIYIDGKKVEGIYDFKIKNEKSFDGDIIPMPRPMSGVGTIDKFRLSKEGKRCLNDMISRGYILTHENDKYAKKLYHIKRNAKSKRIKKKYAKKLNDYVRSRL